MIGSIWMRGRAVLVAALFVVLLATSAAAGSLQDGISTLSGSLNGISAALIAIGTVAGLLLKSPRQAAYSQKIMDAALFLQGDRMRAILETLGDLAEGPAGRRRLAIRLILEDPAAQKLGLTEPEAAKLVDYITAQYKRAPELLELVKR